MAGDWIKFENTTPDKPEVVRLADILGIDQDAVIGKLLRLWVWCDQQSANGDALGVTKTFLDRYTSCTGFCEALIAVGWLKDENGLSIPNYDRHNGEPAKKRALGAKRMKKLRSGDAASATSASPEKRREEKSKSIAAAAATDTDSETLGTHQPDPTDEEPLPKARTKKRDELFDAVAGVTASDPKASGSFIGRVCKKLRESDNPYTPAEVRKWAEMVTREWKLTTPPTLGMLEKHIGRVRAGGVADDSDRPLTREEIDADSRSRGAYRGKDPEAWSK